MPRPLLLPLLLLPLAAACRADPAPAAENERPAARAPASAAWQSNPATGVEIAAGDTVVVRTGPHAVLWRENAPALRPPYRMTATLHKREGRLHEGYGLVFGGAGLDGPEAAQRYSYFLVRGDGSFLIKRRIGEQTRQVRAWTSSPAVRRDDGEAGEPNKLAVRVSSSEAVFFVNDSEVARVPAADVDLAGRAGIRVAHDVEVRMWDWEAADEAEVQQS